MMKVPAKRYTLHTGMYTAIIIAVWSDDLRDEEDNWADIFNVIQKRLFTCVLSFINC